MAVTTNVATHGVELSDWLSIIAIIVSFLAVIATFYLENWRLKRESDSKFFQDIYFSYMKSKIPKAEAKLRFDHNSNRIDGVSEILSVLKNLRKKSSPYKFLDTEFYNQFTQFIENTEDFYSRKQNTVTDSQKFESFQTESRQKISQLYDLLKNKHQNKKKWTNKSKTIF
ncbi:MAG: hypothetical protein MSS16_08765 [Streptococcus orisratti]|uniref:hypothetical protein n=1 Tax=Streptococcus orisratti TaxID=114652 RepID=UPI001551C1C2|nr:hypothetical protein [Streptococcus orisratti]MCI7678146.1 hypothetical protein [Streptococcus orisratti]NQJ66343.1 hypothetical protein [Streptococcus suis]HEL2460934.1 hypothetical protein [Streptococcus suis]